MMKVLASLALICGVASAAAAAAGPAVATNSPVSPSTWVPINAKLAAANPEAGKWFDTNASKYTFVLYANGTYTADTTVAEYTKTACGKKKGVYYADYSEGGQPNGEMGMITKLKDGTYLWAVADSNYGYGVFTLKDPKEAVAFKCGVN